MDVLVGLVVISLLVGGVVGFLVGREAHKKEIAKLKADFEMERQLNLAQLGTMKDTFMALASEVAHRNNQQFLTLANETFQKHRESANRDLQEREKAIEEMVKPVRETLDRFDQKIQEVEKARVGAYEGLSAQVRGLFETQQQLRTETAKLVHALKSPRIRGRWGEIQLKRVVELAGMLDHCDFAEQETAQSENGRLRPDLIIRLPGQKVIVVDAKSPLDAYLAALETNNEDERRGHLTTYAAHIRAHIAQLSKKDYWDRFQPAPEFVFMFLPGESFYSAALEADPSLIENGVSQRVILATPTTLIALLKAVAYGWRQERLADEAEKIGNLGKELYERVCSMGVHFLNLGHSLQKAVEKYNDAVGALESRVLISARRFKDMPITATDKEIESLRQIDTKPRQFQAQEINGHPDQSILFKPDEEFGPPIQEHEHPPHPAK